MIHGFYRIDAQGLGFMIHGFYRVNAQGLGFMIHGFYRVNAQGLGFMIHGFYRINVLDQRFVSRPKLCRFSGAKSDLELVHHAKHDSDP